MDEQRSTPSPDDSLSKDTNVLPHQVALPEPQSNDTQEEQLYQQSLESRMEQLKRDQLDTEESLTNLGLLFHTGIKYGKVMPLDERALTIYEYHYGRANPEVATRLHRLADFYMHSGEYGLAKPLYEQALAIRQQKLSPDHPDTAATLSALAKLYQQQEKYTQAVPLHEQALDIRLKQLGTSHPHTVASVSDLMWTYEQLGSSQKADELSHRFGQLQAQATSTENKTSSPTRLSEKSEKPKEPEQAVSNKRKEAPLPPQKTESSVPRPEEPQRSPLELAERYEQQGQYTQAEQQLLHVLDEKLAQKNSDPLGLARFYITLAEFYRRRRPQAQDALMYYQWAEKIFEQQLGPDHPETRRIRENYILNQTTAQPEKQIKPKFLQSKTLVGIAILAGIVIIAILIFIITSR